LEKLQINKAVLAGLISGVFLGLFLKVVEKTTSLKVYTLLLNVDYVPIIQHYELSEIIEFSIHLFISVVMSVSLLFFLNKKNLPINKRVLFVILLSLVIGVLLYPTTALSNRTPSLTDLTAFGFWLLGHSLYGGILGFLLKK
jgi:L-cystine uptake protein TcyP (sodium:dicarboxylate symporter family)